MTYRKEKTHHSNAKSIIVMLCICLSLVMCIFIAYETITIARVKKDTEEQVNIAFNASNKAQTQTKIAKNSIKSFQDKTQEANETADTIQLESQTAMDAALKAQEEAQYAAELANQAQLEAQNAPEEDAKADALAQAQITSENATKAQEQAQIAMDAANLVQKNANLVVEAITKANSEAQSATQEVANANDAANQSTSASTLAQESFDGFVNLKSSSKAKDIYKTVENCANTSVTKSEEVSISLSNFEAHVKNSSQFFEEIEEMKGSSAEAITQIELTTQATTQAVSETEVASQATTNFVAKANSQAKQAKASSGGGLTKSKGVVIFNGHRETWYSERVLPGTGLNIPGRHADESGVIRDGDGYICVASMDYPKGTVIETSLGAGKVYDYCGVSGTIDIYTNW